MKIEIKEVKKKTCISLWEIVTWEGSFCKCCNERATAFEITMQRKSIFSLRICFACLVSMLAKHQIWELLQIIEKRKAQRGWK